MLLDNIWSTGKAGLALRARIVLLAADGVGTGEIVRRVGVSKPTAPPTIDRMTIVLATLEPPPERLGVTALVEPAARPNNWESVTSR